MQPLPNFRYRCRTCTETSTSAALRAGGTSRTHGVSHPAIEFCAALAESGHTLGITVEDVTGYTHGKYPYESSRRRNEEYVRVSVWQATTTPGSSTRDSGFFLTVGEAYRLAAVLTRAAQVADEFDVPVKRASWVDGGDATVAAVDNSPARSRCCQIAGASV